MIVTWLADRRWLIIALFAAVGFALQSTTFINQDIAWIVYSSARMLHGAVFGRDVIDQNPPLIWYLAMPVAFAWDQWGVDPAIPSRILCVVAVIGILAWIDRYPRIAPQACGRVEISILMLTMAYWLLIGGGESIGQREYLALVLSLPYILIVPARYDGLALPYRKSVPIGIVAAIAFALKPNFLIVPALLECAGLANARRLRPLFRTEICIIGALVGVYLLSLLIFAPTFTAMIVPYIVKYYWANDRSWAFVLLRDGAYIVILAMNCYVYACAARSVLRLANIAASVGFLVSYVVQAKGYAYHAFPFEALVAASAALNLIPTANRKTVGAVSLAAGIGAFGLNLSQVGHWYMQENTFFSPRATQLWAIADLIDRHASGGSFLVLAGHPYPAFPTALYTKAAWASRTESSDYLAAVARLRAGDSKVGAASLPEAEARAWAALKHDLDQYHPQIILVADPRNAPSVENIHFNILVFYLENSAIRVAWDSYTEGPRLGDFRVFIRKAAAAQ